MRKAMGRRDFKIRPQAKFKKLGELTKKEAREEVESLREGIEYHDHLYYVENKPKISDALYDKLFRRLLPRTSPAPAPGRRLSSPARRCAERENPAAQDRLRDH